MNFGYCINMLSLPGSDGTGREMLPMLKELGFDYVELPLAQMMAYNDDEFDQLFIEPLNKNGLCCLCCNNFFPSFIHLTGPDADHSAACAYAEKAMSRTQRLGAKKIVFGSAAARNYPVSFPRKEADRQLTQILQLLEPIAEANNIVLVMEHLNKTESNMLNSLQDAVSLVSDLQLPHVGCLVDNYHMMVGGGSLDEIRKAKGYLRHVHLARPLGRALPIEGDEICWKSIFSVLHEIGYDGDCSIEAYVPENGRKLKIQDSLHFLRSLA